MVGVESRPSDPIRKHVAEELLFELGFVLKPMGQDEAFRPLFRLGPAFPACFDIKRLLDNRERLVPNQDWLPSPDFEHRW
jgi:hypothetical protein